MTTLFRLADWDIDRRRLVERAVHPLKAFGLLTDAEAAAVADVLQEIERAEACGYNATQRAQRACAEVAQRVLDGTLDIDSVDHAIAAIPDPAGVVGATTVIATNLIWRASDLAFARSDHEYVEVVNRELAAVTERAEDLAVRLGTVDNAEAALAAGVGDAWLELGRLQAHHEELTALIEILRDAKKLPAANTVEYGPWWRTRRIVNLGASRYYSQSRDPRLLFLDEACAGLYYPAREDEAEAVRQDHEAERAEFAEGIRAAQ